MFATLSGAEAADSRLATLPQAVPALIEAKARSLADALAARVRDDKLSGQWLAVRSGALKGSIAAQVSTEGETLAAVVGSFADIKYAAIQEYGGRTAAHEILPDKQKALAFLTGAGRRFARRIEHPGSILQGRAYLRSSLEEMRDEIVAALAAAPTEAWDDT